MKYKKHKDNAHLLEKLLTDSKKRNFLRKQIELNTGQTLSEDEFDKIIENFRKATLP